MAFSKGLKMPLGGAVLVKAKLTDAILTDAALYDADLTAADLTRAVISHANMGSVPLFFTHMQIEKLFDIIHKMR